MNKVAIVTGGNSGIGRETALALLGKGCTVYEFSRRDNAPQGVMHVACDVSNEEQYKAAINAVFEKEGHIDILVNNAGFGISGAAEFTTNEDAKRLLDVNLFGVVNGCKAILPIMRNQGYGRIVNLSSVAAPCAIPFQVWYSVSKAAVSTYTAALQNEVKPFGITLTAIMPGDIKTGFTKAREKSPLGDDIYNGRIAKSVAVMEHDEENGMDPKFAGNYIASIALRKNVKVEYAIGFKYKFLAVLARLLPCRLRNWIIGLLYAQ